MNNGVRLETLCHTDQDPVVEGWHNHLSCTGGERNDQRFARRRQV